MKLDRIIDKKSYNLLNIGCGSKIHPDWINLDLSPSPPLFISCDLRKGIPLPTESCDVVYHSHVLEHLTRAEADFLIKECNRVLKTGGILRVVVPDLENIARKYLEVLDLSLKGQVDDFKYHWSVLELYDQAVRQKPGGEMKEIIESANMEQEAYIQSRIGREGKPNEERKRKIGEILSRPVSYWKYRGYRIIQNLKMKTIETIIYLVFGRKIFSEYKEGKFRSSGEPHFWMYDRYSLGKMLTRNGFSDVKTCKAEESRIPNFNSYRLDIEEGKTRKPESLFMECTKP